MSFDGQEGLEEEEQNVRKKQQPNRKTRDQRDTEPHRAEGPQPSGKEAAKPRRGGGGDPKGGPLRQTLPKNTPDEESHVAARQDAQRNVLH